MQDFFLLMGKPFLACLVLTGIHAYLGIHVIERKVIFVDLALAQIAALGATAAFLFGLDLHGPVTYWFSLAATCLGAVLLSVTRARRERVPQEVVVGVVYAASAAAALLILSRSAEGDEHIRFMLGGNILLVSLRDIVKMCVIYGAVGILHYLFRDKLILVSTRPEEAFKKRVPVRAWDLFFYLTFGLVVTSSAAIAGVLLVFSFLIVPAVIAIFVARSFSARLLVGWGFGILGSFLGLCLSYFFDLPTGPSIVCSFAGLFLIMYFTGAK